MRTLARRTRPHAGALTAVAGLYESVGAQARADGIVDIPRELVSFFISPYPDEVTVNMTRVVDIDPLDPDDLTRAEVEARLQVMQLLDFFRRRVPGFEQRAYGRDRDADRHSRIAPHRRTLHADAATTCCRRGSSTTPSRAARIRSTFTIRRGSGTTTMRLPPGAAYEIPYRCLVPVDRRAAAGRRALHLDDARSARIDALDADRDDARSSGRYGGGAWLARGTCASARSIRSELREQLVADGVDLRRQPA